MPDDAFAKPIRWVRHFRSAVNGPALCGIAHSPGGFDDEWCDVDCPACLRARKDDGPDNAVREKD